MNERYEWDRRMNGIERYIWQDWFRKHGVDPSDIPIPGWVERRPEDYQLVFEVYDRKDGKFWRYRDGDNAARRTVVMQLEGPPLPFPAIPGPPWVDEDPS